MHEPGFLGVDDRGLADVEPGVVRSHYGIGGYLGGQIFAARHSSRNYRIRVDKPLILVRGDLSFRRPKERDRHLALDARALRRCLYLFNEQENQET